MLRGLLANVLAIPPLIFRFQFNPDLLQERKHYKYQQADSFGRWVFDQREAAASSFVSKTKGLWEDLKEFGPLLTATKPMQAMEGDPRQYQLEFNLDSRERLPRDPDDPTSPITLQPVGKSLERDLQVLRSFMYPGWDWIDIAGWISRGPRELPCWNKPPSCTLIFGPLSFDCVMEDLDIKITDFNEDLSAARAEVTIRLIEQTHSTTPVIDFGKRTVEVLKSIGREGFGEDLGRATPIVNLFTK